MKYLQDKRLFFFKALISAIALGLLGSCGALVGPRDVQINNQAIEYFTKEQPAEAHNLWMNQLDELPLQPEVHFNLGLSYEVTKNVDFAQNYYLQTLKLSKSNDLKFYSLFNLAQLAAKQKEVNKALDFYQMALELKPDHFETKVNIELLIQQQQQDQQQQQQQEKQNQDQQQGQGQNQDQKQDPNQPQQNPDEKKDKSDEENKEKDKDKSSDKNDEKDKSNDEDPDKKYEKNQKYQPRPFQGKELDQNDVNKILSELKQQEQKIRSNFNRKKVKEEPREKDW